MIEFLYSIDRAILLFLNRTLANPVTDVLWPLVTDYDKLLPVRLALALVWLWMLLRDGTRGRTAALLLIPLLVLTDQINSSFLKELFHRARPCHLIEGEPVVQGLRLLVGCGSGLSFPSSHAVNNFGVATLLASFYPRIRWWLFGAAALVALSRPAVGVHYPSDILAGAVVGWGIASVVLFSWRGIARNFRLGLAILCGLMLGFSFPPSQTGILACFALVPLLILVAEIKETGRLLRYTYLAMVIFHAIVLSWTGGFSHGNDPYMMIAGTMTILLHPFFYFIPVGITHWLKKVLGLWPAMLAFPLLWLAYEYSHTLSEWSFPWLTLGNTQTYDLARMQIAAVTGVWGLSLWVLTVNLLGFWLLVRVSRSRRVWADRASWGIVALIVALVAAPRVYGEYVLKGADREGGKVPQDAS